MSAGHSCAADCSPRPCGCCERTIFHAVDCEVTKANDARFRVELRAAADAAEAAAREETDDA